MKYTIEGFLQEKLAQYKLKVDDALILRWFLDYAACGKMKRVVQENANGKNVYYWVNYQAVIEEFPCLDISNTKSIQIKFNKYVELGLLTKIVHSGGANGKQSYYAITEKCLELEYSSTPASPKIKNNEENLTKTKPKQENGVEKNFQSVEKTSPEWKKISSPQVPLEKNFQSGVEKNFQSVYINSSTKNSSTTLSNPSSLTEAERINKLKESVKNYFDGSLALFSDDLIPRLCDLTQALSLEKLPLYVKYTYLLVQAQKPNKPHGMFYKFILQKNTLEAFCDSIKPVVKKFSWNCPVCHSEQTKEVCSCCGLNYDFRTSEKEIKLHKDIYDLPEQKRKELFNDLEKLNCGNLTDFVFAQKQKKATYAKYGVNYE